MNAGRKNWVIRQRRTKKVSYTSTSDGKSELYVKIRITWKYPSKKYTWDWIDRRFMRVVYMCTCSFLRDNGWNHASAKRASTKDRTLKAKPSGIGQTNQELAIHMISCYWCVWENNVSKYTFQQYSWTIPPPPPRLSPLCVKIWSIFHITFIYNIPVFVWHLLTKQLI